MDARRRSPRSTQAVGDRVATGRADFVSYHDTSVETTKGKGHAEARAILTAMNSSRLLQRCDRVAKVTGRYFVENMDEWWSWVETPPDVETEDDPIERLAVKFRTLTRGLDHRG